MNRGNLRSSFMRKLFGELRLGNVHVGQVGDLCNVFRCQCQPVKFAAKQQGTKILQTTLHVVQLLAVQAVADFQVVIEKAQWRADGEGV